MKLHLTKNLKLEEQGWELLINEGNPLPAGVDDLVKIVLVTISPLDFDKKETPRSVSHEAIWVKVKSLKDGEYTGELKSQPGYDLQTKDGTTFKIGDEIHFNQENIKEIRN
ncbi:hypothetical protein IT411_02325 [Candidatus Peregrinibacteria bacterium]|nr:hypothetical protein [Candidatus Peregrinibacteria bacterium]